MDLDDGAGAQARFEQYTADLASVLGHADRVRPFADYCVGLLSAEGRKSVEPLAAEGGAGLDRDAGGAAGMGGDATDRFSPRRAWACRAGRASTLR